MVNALHENEKISMIVEETSVEDSEYSRNFLFVKLCRTFLDRDPYDIPIINFPSSILDNGRSMYILPHSITFKRSDITPYVKLVIETSFLTCVGNPTKLWSQRIIRSLIQEIMLKMWGNPRYTGNYYSDGVFATHFLALDYDYSF